MNKLVLIFFFASLLIISCNKEDNTDAFNIGTESEFQHGSINKSADNSLNFSIIEINDSRCPSDVECVWQGKADIKLEIESPQKGILTLNTYDNLIDTFANYSFELIEVSPYPISTKNITLDNYIVTLEINQITQNH